MEALDRGGGAGREAVARAEALLRRIEALGSEEARAGMARYGIRTDDAFGVSVYELRRIARELGSDHELALALWVRSPPKPNGHSTASRTAIPLQAEHLGAKRRVCLAKLHVLFGFRSTCRPFSALVCASILP